MVSLFNPHIVPASYQGLMVDHSFKLNLKTEYTGTCWKHHAAASFEKDGLPTHPNGAGAGGTVFTDFDKMVEQLEKWGGDWYVAELYLRKTPLIFEFGNDWMATITVNKLSESGFKPLKSFL